MGINNIVKSICLTLFWFLMFGLALATIMFFTGCAATGGLGFTLQKFKDSQPTADRLPNYIRSIAPVRWKHTPVTYAIYGGDSNVPGISIPSTVDRGVNRWSPHLNGIGTVLKRVAAKGDEDISIKIVNSWTLRDETGADRGVLANTWLNYVKGDAFAIKHSDIRILRSLLPEEMEQVSIHEFGHALGIRGHSPDGGDVMYSVAHIPIHLTQADVNTMTLIYEGKTNAK